MLYLLGIQYPFTLLPSTPTAVVAGSDVSSSLLLPPSFKLTFSYQRNANANFVWPFVYNIIDVLSNNDGKSLLTVSTLWDGTSSRVSYNGVVVADWAPTFATGFFLKN